MTLCPCCHEPVTDREHAHMAQEAIDMLEANLAVYEAAGWTRPR